LLFIARFRGLKKLPTEHRISGYQHNVDFQLAFYQHRASGSGHRKIESRRFQSMVLGLGRLRTCHCGSYVAFIRLPERMY